MIITASQIKETEKAINFIITFWIGRHDYFWYYWFPKIRVKIIDEELIEISDQLFQNLKEDIRLRHTFKKVSYNLAYGEVKWIENEVD